MKQSCVTECLPNGFINGLYFCRLLTFLAKGKDITSALVVYMCKKKL